MNNPANSLIRLAKLFALSVFTFSGILYILPADSHALSANYTIKLCEKNYIGANYKPYLEKKCGLLWSKWTFDILNTNN